MAEIDPTQNYLRNLTSNIFKHAGIGFLAGASVVLLTQNTVPSGVLHQMGHIANMSFWLGGGMVAASFAVAKVAAESMAPLQMNPGASFMLSAVVGAFTVSPLISKIDSRVCFKTNLALTLITTVFFAILSSGFKDINSRDEISYVRL